jgi:hypothetical protein
MIDCEIPNEVVDGQRVFESQMLWSERPTVGEIVAGLQVTPTGPNPDINIQPEITGDIALGEGDGAYTFGILDDLGKFVWAVLNEFAPLLRSPDA